MNPNEPEVIDGIKYYEMELEANDYFLCDYCLCTPNQLLALGTITQKELETFSFIDFRNESLCPGCYEAKQEQAAKGTWKFAY